MIQVARRPGLWAWVAFGVGALPWAWLRALGAVVGWLAGSVFRIRRREVERSMQIAGVARPGSTASAMYRSLGAGALEFLWLASRGRRALSHVAIDDASAAAWQSALAAGRGVVIAGSHTGNWDLAACALASRCELLVVTKRLRATTLDSFWQATRAALGVALADARGAMSDALGVLARGGAVVMMIDQVPPRGRHAVKALFQGREALVSRAAAALALRSGAPLVVAASRRDPRGCHWLHVLGVLEPPAKGGLAWIERATVEGTQILDRFVAVHPTQWLWLHRRWREPRAEGARPTAGALEVDRSPVRGTLARPCKTPSSLPDARSQVA